MVPDGVMELALVTRIKGDVGSAQGIYQLFRMSVFVYSLKKVFYTYCRAKTYKINIEIKIYKIYG